MDDFAQLGLSDKLSSALASFGFASPTPVQKTAIPLILNGKDLYMESETGTGKTFAYLAPAIHLIGSPLQISSKIPVSAPDPVSPKIPDTPVDDSASMGIQSGDSSVQRYRRPDGPGLLIAAPTQELAVQIGREAERLVAAAGLHYEVAVLLGGSPLSKQEAALKKRPAIVVGTLGRLSDLARSSMLRVRGLSVIVFDEADRMLAPETEAEMLGLLKLAPCECVRVLVSATLPVRIRTATASYMHEPIAINVKGEPVLAGDIEHWCLYCDARKRVDFVRRFEAAVHPARCLVFMAQAGRVEETAERLSARDLPVEAISARMDKEERRVALDRFARGEIRYLITSDLAARGLDIAGITHIVSLDLPEESTIYTHRAGRTGRAGAKGVSVVLADRVELDRASRMAVKGGFVFRCKMLAEGKILEPSTSEFFQMVDEAWNEKSVYRKERDTVSPAQRSTWRANPRQYGEPSTRGHNDAPAYRQPRNDAPRNPDRPRREVQPSYRSGESPPSGNRQSNRDPAPHSEQARHDSRPESRSNYVPRTPDSQRDRFPGSNPAAPRARFPGSTSSGSIYAPAQGGEARYPVRRSAEKPGWSQKTPRDGNSSYKPGYSFSSPPDSRPPAPSHFRQEKRSDIARTASRTGYPHSDSRSGAHHASAPMQGEKKPRAPRDGYERRKQGK